MYVYEIPHQPQRIFRCRWGTTTTENIFQVNVIDVRQSSEVLFFTGACRWVTTATKNNFLVPLNEIPLQSRTTFCLQFKYINWNNRKEQLFGFGVWTNYATYPVPIAKHEKPLLDSFRSLEIRQEHSYSNTASIWGHFHDTSVKPWNCSNTQSILLRSYAQELFSFPFCSFRALNNYYLLSSWLMLESGLGVFAWGCCVGNHGVEYDYVYDVAVP